MFTAGSVEVKRLRAAGIVVAATLTAFGLRLPVSMPAAATGPTVTGAGSTWVAIALDQWRADIAQH